MEEEKRFISYLCPRCAQSVIAGRDRFSLAAAPARIRCPCGGSEVRVELMGAQAHIRVPCLYCGVEHRVRCDANAFLQQKALAFSCGVSGLDCCYVGQEREVYAATARMERVADRLSRPRGAFLNETVMHETLSELRDIARRGGIACQCGSGEWKLEIRFGCVELRCARCGAQTRIPAATQEDLDELCCRDKIFIH